MSDLINPAMAGSYLITLNYHFVGGDAEILGAYAEDLVRAAFEEIADLQNNFSALASRQIAPVIADLDHLGVIEPSTQPKGKTKNG